MAAGRVRGFVLEIFLAMPEIRESPPRRQCAALNWGWTADQPALFISSLPGEIAGRVPDTQFLSRYLAPALPLLGHWPESLGYLPVFIQQAGVKLQRFAVKLQRLSANL